MNKKKKFPLCFQDGLSLMELVVMLGIMGIVTMMSMHLMKLQLSTQRRAESVTTSFAEFFEVLDLVARVQNLGMSWTSMDYEKTYTFTSSSVGFVDWDLTDTPYNGGDLDDLNFTLDNPNHSSEEFRLSSHLISIQSASGRQSVMFSRCVPRSQAVESLSVGQARDLERVPIIEDVDSTQRMSCCEIDSDAESISCEEVTDINSTERVITFILGPTGSLRYLPRSPDVTEVDSIGFFVHINRDRNPTSFTARVASLNESCDRRNIPRVRVDGKLVCDIPFYIESRDIVGPVQRAGVHDRGILRLN